MTKFRSEQRPAAPLKAQRGHGSTAFLLGRGTTESKTEGKEQSGSKPSSSGSDGCLPPAPLSTTAPPSFFFPSRQSSGRRTGHHRDGEQRTSRFRRPPHLPLAPSPPPADRCGRPPPQPAFGPAAGTARAGGSPAAERGEEGKEDSGRTRLWG